MKVVAIFCMFAIGLVLARAPIEEWRFLDNVMPQRSIEDSSFRQGREYKFFYNGQLTTGIPGSSKQHSGSRIQSLVTFAFTSANTVLMRMEQVRMGKMNRPVPHPQKIMPFESFETTELDAKMKELLETPVKFSYMGGLVKDIKFDGKEQPWSANIKRAVLNLIQVNLQQQKRLDTVEDQRLSNLVSTSEDSDDSTFYRVMEQTLEGDCETLYTVTRQPHPKYQSQVLNVTKSINFERCQKRPHIKYNFRFSHSCPTCESKYNDDEKFLKSSTVAKFNISGTKDSFLIESVRIESQHVFVPFNEESNVIVSYINQTLVLIKTGPFQGQIQEPQNQIESDSDMIYTLDWDVEREKMQMEGRTDSRYKLPMANEFNKVEMAQDQIQKVVSKIQESVQEGSPRAFSRLIAVLRMCNKQELERISEKYIRRDGEQQSNEEQQKAKDILPQALAVCGTKDCVSQLLKHIRQQEIHVVKGALAIKSLINVRTPSKEIIQELIQFSQQSELMERSRILKQSTWLTIGSLMNALCAPNEDTLAREHKDSTEKFCPRSLKQSYVELLFRKGQESNRWDDNVLFMKAISNAGLDLSVFELEKFISQKDKHYQPYLRVQAILALRQLRDIMPKKIQKILMPIVLNKRENPTVRMVATHMLLQSLPSRPILDQLAKLTHHDPSLQLTSFLRSYMDSIANSTNPCEHKLATDMRLSLRHAKVVDTGLGHSKRVKIPFHSKKHSVGMDLNLYSLFSNTSYIPRSLTAQLNANFLGFWHKSLAQLTVAGEGLEQLLEKMFNEDDSYLYETESDSFLRRHSREQNEFRSELKNIFDTLKIKTRQQPEEQTKEPKAYISLKVKDQEIAMLPFHKETIQRLLGENSNNVREWEAKLRQGIPLNMHGATVLHEMMYKIPTTLGLPLLVNVRIPAVVKLSGKIQASYDSWSKINIQANLKPSMVVTMITEVESWTPTGDNGVKVIARAELFTPIDARIETDFKNNDVEDIKITVKTPTTRRDLLVIETRPVTYTREWPKTVNQWQEPEEKTIMGEELNRAVTYQRCGGEKALGVEFCVRGHVHRTPAKSITGTPFAPLSGPNKIVVTCQPGQDAPEEVTFKVDTQMWQSVQESLKPSFKSSEFSRELRSNEMRSNEDSNERSGESEYKNYEVKNGKRNSVKINVEARNRKLSIELAHHYDPQDQFSKFNAKIVRSPLPNYPEQWTGCLNTEFMFPKKPYKLTEVDDKEIVGNAQFTWGKSCESSENRITLKVKGEQSKEQIEQYSRDPEYQQFEKCEDASLCSPISQHDYLKQISQLLKYTIDIEHKNVPVAAKNVTNKLFLFLKHYYYWQTDIAQIMVRNPEDKIKAIIRIDPLTLQRVNITVKTQSENTTFKDLPLPMRMSGFNTKNSWDLNNQFTDTCHVSSNKIQTFDDVEYKVPMTTCYAVLAKDCSPEPSFAVLMKKQSEGTERKEVKIITQEHRIVLRHESGDRITVQVNGEQVNPEEYREFKKHNHVVCRVEKEGPYVKIVLPESGVKVYFDGYACNVKLSKMYQNQQCGLCGHYDEEYSDEFRTAEFKRTDDVREFYKSYIIQDGQCSLPSDDNICRDEQCEYQPAWESNDRIESEEEQLTSEKPVYRTKSVEYNDQLCFSTVPLPQCAQHSYAERYGNEKNINFVCFDRDDYAAEQYERQVRNGETLDLKSRQTTFARTEKLVEKCSSFY